MKGGLVCELSDILTDVEKAKGLIYYIKENIEGVNDRTIIELIYQNLNISYFEISKIYEMEELGEQNENRKVKHWYKALKKIKEAKRYSGFISHTNLINMMEKLEQRTEGLSKSWDGDAVSMIKNLNKGTEGHRGAGAPRGQGNV